MFSFCSQGECRRSRRPWREQDAVPDNGIAVERREAPGPTSLGPRARKRQPLVTGDLPWRAPNPGFGFGNRRRSAGGASRRSIPLWGKRKKGNGGPARAPEFKARVRELMAGCEQVRSLRAICALLCNVGGFHPPLEGEGRLPERSVGSRGGVISRDQAHPTPSSNTPSARSRASSTRYARRSPTLPLQGRVETARVADESTEAFNAPRRSPACRADWPLPFAAGRPSTRR